MRAAWILALSIAGCAPETSAMSSGECAEVTDASPDPGLVTCAVVCVVLHGACVANDGCYRCVTDGGDK